MAKGLTKVYKAGKVETPALRGVDLEIHAGEFTAVVGPSGSGKTTLLNLIGALDSATGGELKVLGRSVNTLSKRARADMRLHELGFVFQAYNLVPVLTAQENVEFIMEVQGWRREERRARAMELLVAVGLEERAESRPSKMSGGQQQRVAVARALASKPKFVLADEPTANLDSKSTATLLDIMEKLNREEDITFIFSTHDQRVVNKARRVITIEDGHVVSDIRK